MTDGQGGSQRHFPRIRNVLLVEISRFDERGFRADMAHGRTLDLSYGGLRLELDHPLPLRSIVALTLALGENLVQIQGKVVYLQQIEGSRCAMGVQFTEVAPRSRQTLDSYVEKIMAINADRG